MPPMPLANIMHVECLNWRVMTQRRLSGEMLRG